MTLRLNLQWRVLMLIAMGMSLTLLLSGYLHGLITSALIEDDRYNTAIGHTVAIAERIASRDLFGSPEHLQRDLRLVTDARSDFKQIDVYHGSGLELRLVASTAPAAPRLPTLDETTPDNDLHEMERPLPGVTTMEVVRHGVRYWMISIAINGHGTGYVTALVLKNSFNPLVRRLQIQHNLVLAGAIAGCVALFYLLFAHFFRRPARDIVRAMTLARGGHFSFRAEVRRNDELGEIARGFNVMMDDLSARDREREGLLTKINRFNDELRVEIDHATSELRAVNEALFQSQQRLGRSERLAAMGQVAGTLAHEIGTPLNSISGHLQLLARRLPDDGDAQRRLKIINEQLEAIVGSVRALLRRTDRRRLSVRPTDLNALIGELLRLVGPTLDAHAITLSPALDPALPRVAADGDALRQVFLNLINNSVDAMPTGGQLEIATRNDSAAGVVEVTVRDTGIGIPADALEHLFEPMWTTKETGSGFGLAIAREIMTEHGGRIDAEADCNGGPGALFRVRVPLAVTVAAT